MERPAPRVTRASDTERITLERCPCHGAAVAIDARDLTAVSTVVGAVAWPLVVLLVAWLFRKALRDVVTRAHELSVTAPGVSITAKREAAATQALVRAAASKSRASGLSRGTLRLEVEEASRVVEDFGRPPRLLWVDDRPSNNRHEVAAFEALGMVVELSTSTEDALRKISDDSRRFDLVISDMGRREGPMEGYVLLDALRKRKYNTPFLIYAASRKPEHYDESVRRGALGCTNRPKELMRMVLRALRAAVESAD